jgi:hypothetical protein
MRLPNDPLYCPVLSCTVYDNIFKSFLQPMIGVYSIPIGKFIHEKKQQRKEEIEKFEFLISELEKVMLDNTVSSYLVKE